MDHNFANMRVLMQVGKINFVGMCNSLNKHRFWIKISMTTFKKMETFPISTFAIDGFYLISKGNLAILQYTGTTGKD